MRYFEFESEEGEKENGGFISEYQLYSVLHLGKRPEWLPKMEKITVYPRGLWEEPYPVEGWRFPVIFKALTENGFIYRTTIWKENEYSHIFVRTDDEYNSNY